MRKRGFTLIELLAVIVILAIIALIATPIIMNVIDDSKKGAFKNSAYGIIETAELKYATDNLNNIKEAITFTYTDGVESSEPSGRKLEYKGNKPQNGTVVIDEHGEISLAIHDGKYCAYKNAGSNSVMVQAMSKEECEAQRTLVYTDASCFTFDINTKTILKYDFDNCPKNVVIPEEINGVKVEHIGPGAFTDAYSQSCRVYDPEVDDYYYEETELNYIKNETDIYEYCTFYVDDKNNKYIASVILPYNLKTIGYDAFSGNQLTEIKIPDNVISIGNWAFYKNDLTNVEIGSGVTNMGDNPFAGNGNLNTITISTTNPAYKSENNAIYTKDGKILVAGTRQMRNNILNTVTIIGNEAFYKMDLENVTIPNGVTKIGDWAFAYNDLSSVTIPNTVTVIGAGALEGNNLSQVTIPNSVTKIGDSAFYDNALTSVTIPNGITAIKNSTFSYNELSSVTIPNSVVRIGDEAFSNNYLTSISIPSSVTTIGDWAFYWNYLTNVNIPNGVVTIGEHAFSYNEVSSVSISNSVTTIGKSAFYWNYLTSVNVPNSVINLGGWAFGWNLLTSAGIGSGVTNMGANPFAGNPDLSTLSVASSNPSYKLENNAVYTKDGTTLVIGTKQMASSIPSTVTTLVLAHLKV